MTKKQKKVLIRIIISAVLMVAIRVAYVFIGDGESKHNVGVLIKEPFWFIAYMVPYLLIGYDILRKAFKGIIKGQLLDENFLMAIATIGAIALALIQKSGDYIEAVAVMLFYQVGELFQSIAVGKSRRNISALMDIRPDYANVEIDGKIEQVDPDEVEIGTEIIVNPGEKVPIDGIVVDGKSTLNTAALTGESLPREVQIDDEIISGSVNLNGVLRIRTTKPFGESTVSKILELVENASSRKAKSEEFISKFARVYTPAVCFSALALAVIPPLVQILFMHAEPSIFMTWIYRALTFLVISCPCALVVSIPLTFFAGIGGAGKAGILIKGSNYMETLSKVSTVVFDKTGTLTKGVFEVTGVHHNEIENKKLLEYAALAESASSHPIGKSLQAAYGKEIDRTRVSDIEEIAGEGITANVDGKKIYIGNHKLMHRMNVPHIDCHCVGTIIHIAIDDVYAGHIVISDVEKENSKEAISELKKAGIRRCVMLTGDAKKVAEDVAARLGVDEVRSELLPADKVNEVEKILVSNTTGKLAFVGDGINDAPVLTRADIGIAMGAMGSDAAIEAADVVLMDDDPIKIAKAIRISSKCLRIVYENIIFALVVKFACLALGALGFANMWLAIFADVGVMVIAILNAIRALRVGK